MEARTAFRGPAISKSSAAVVAAVLAALMLGGGGGYMVKTWSLPARAVAPHIVAGADVSGFGTAWNYSTRRSGTQIVDGPAVAATLTATSIVAGRGASAPGFGDPAATGAVATGAISTRVTLAATSIVAGRGANAPGFGDPAATGAVATGAISTRVTFRAPTPGRSGPQS
jgi:hypothetical protein